MKPPVVHQPVQPPSPAAGPGAGSPAGAAAPGQPAGPADPATGTPGLVGSYGPLVTGPAADDPGGAGADERKKP